MEPSLTIQAQSKVAEVHVGKLAANLIGTVLTIVFCVFGVLLARMLPDHARFEAWHAAALLVAFVVLLPIHEALHAVGLLVFAKVSWRHIRFGVFWHALMPYCHCTVAISIRDYRRMALLPLWITGGVSIAFLLVFPADWSGVFAGIAVAACVGDVWVVAKLRGFAESLLVQDSPSEIGCDIYSTTP